MFEKSQYAAVLKELPEDLKPLVETYYWTGWRKGELLTLRWSQIDFMRGEMRAGVADRKVHDFRRTAVDRLEWSGVPRVVAMKLTGTRLTRSTRGIARGKDLRAGVARVADYVETLNGSVQESGKEPATTIRAQKGASRK